MPKIQVKLLWITGRSHYCQECDVRIATGVEDTEWEEIEAAQYYELRTFVDRHNKKSAYGDKQLVMVRKPSPEEGVTVAKTVTEFLAQKKKEEAARAKMDKEYDEKRAEQKRKRELKRLEALQKKYGSPQS